MINFCLIPFSYIQLLEFIKFYSKLYMIATSQKSIFLKNLTISIENLRHKIL